MGNISRRLFTQNTLSSVLTYSLLEACFSGDVFGNKVSPITTNWFNDLNQLGLDLKDKNISQLVWQEKIEELYAIGPAISILMEGYVQKKPNLISLRGTLVPATTINKFVASIPLLGNILVGKKTGEGVFGVSFKIKGPKDDLKTSVNPIKTLAPRFITRTLEKVKK